MRSFHQLFARSPFGPLAKHGERVNDVVQLLKPVTDAFLAEEWDRVAELDEQISRAEHKADEVKEEIRDNLPKSLFLPVDRGDLLRFLHEQDGIADSVEDVAVLMNMRRTVLPDEVRQAFAALVDKIVATGEVWFDLSQSLPGLQEASFTGPEVTRVLEIAQELNDLEFQADQLQAILGRLAVKHEEEIGPIGFFFLMRIANAIGKTANKAENTADLLRMMLAPS